jgi:hypothetical protein
MVEIALYVVDFVGHAPQVVVGVVVNDLASEHAAVVWPVAMYLAVDEALGVSLEEVDLSCETTVIVVDGCLLWAYSVDPTVCWLKVSVLLAWLPYPS